MPHNDEIYLMSFVFFILAISAFGIIWMSGELLIIKYKEYKQKENKMLVEEIYKLISETQKPKSKLKEIKFAVKLIQPKLSFKLSFNIL